MKSDMNDMMIRTLIEKFFDGATSIAEEQALYEYFGSDNVSAEFVQYRELFCSFRSTGIPDTDTSVRKKPLMARTGRAVVGVMAAAVAAFGFFLIKDISHERHLTRIYGGSYIIVNGERIDDLSEIKGDIEKTLCTASAIERRADMDATIRKAEANVLGNIPDNNERERIYRLLNE
ncbi:hypothetical protein HPS54_05835 [Prevotella sp. PCHR]|uniref:Uncharacterized protein n=1 Tax=Xylanibacter caecicola TaxID=2736294 RepID=A0ABX2B4X8_9BACT|nr:hypothetical protein [Xylanibacter caecicola]NPE25040.1 hypothetical protein [Xylanibacter caecicola]